MEALGSLMASILLRNVEESEEDNGLVGVLVEKSGTRRPKEAMKWLFEASAEYWYQDTKETEALAIRKDLETVPDLNLSIESSTRSAIEHRKERIHSKHTTLHMFGGIEHMALHSSKWITMLPISRGIVDNGSEFERFPKKDCMGSLTQLRELHIGDFSKELEAFPAGLVNSLLHPNLIESLESL
ncbi:hypothetical protein SADUNF_Sadunf13G0105100 [Salix dunnii]|uniref:Uncharacterized protein n=1 Tax=Salix dunnii TaxID=1413687 RepID=A0A835JGI1_9ROSI|nr:hypothetical protein SADUNF_Sadunf13G0105100 [Salix dunnii]